MCTVCECALCVCALSVCVCPVCVLCFVVPCLMMVSIAKALTAASDINANKLRQFLAVFFSFFFLFGSQRSTTLSGNSRSWLGFDLDLVLSSALL